MKLYDPITGKLSMEYPYSNKDAYELVINKYNKQAKIIAKELKTKKDN